MSILSFTSFRGTRRYVIFKSNLEWPGGLANVVFGAVIPRQFINSSFSYFFHGILGIQKQNNVCTYSFPAVEVHGGEFSVGGLCDVYIQGL